MSSDTKDEISRWKDEFLKWIVPALLTGVVYELNQVSSAMIEHKVRIGFVEYRIDQHRNTLLEHTGQIADTRARVGILEALRNKENK